MTRLATEHDILENAIEAIRRETGLPLSVEALKVNKGGKRIDAIIRLPGKGPALAAEIKKWATHLNLGATINQIQQIADPGKGLLIADYINAKIGKMLKEAGIQYVDTAGNAYINQPPVFIFITGRKPETKAVMGSAFQPAGLKIVFALLVDQNLVNAPYREIASRANVALGAIGGVLRDLIARGYLIEDSNGERQLDGYDALLEKWVEDYPYKLREKQQLGTFTTDSPEWWRDIDPGAYGAAWGGEIAAASYTGYLEPRDAIVYIRKADMAGLLNNARLRKVRGNESPIPRIDLIEPFWASEEGVVERGLVHPLLVYADLVATADPRNLDTANRLREKYLR